MEKAKRELGWLPSVCHQRAIGGFTLAELLICLAILGVIATFTIPKIITNQQNSAYKAAALETAATISSAYQNYKLTNPVTSSFGMQTLTPFINYISVDTSSPMDDRYGALNWNCSSTAPCLRLHNGGVLRYFTGATFGGTAATNAVFFHFDPDGVYGGTTNGPGKAVPIFLYYNGAITDEGNLSAGTTASNGSYPATPGNVPPWFTWN